MRLQPTQSDPPRPPGFLYLRFLIWLLRILGFKLTTISQALNSSFGRFACLTFDMVPEKTATDQLSQLAPKLARQGVRATVFCSTRGTAWPARLRKIHALGWEAGSLGHEPVDLTTRSYVEQRRFVSRSRSRIADVVGAPPAVFSYPFGAYDATTVSCVKNEGFAAAVTLCHGINNGTTPTAYHLRRLPLRGQWLADLFLIFRTIWKPSPRDNAVIPTSAPESSHNGAAV